MKQSCEHLQTAIDMGKYNVEEEYIEVLESLGKFLNVFHEFSINLSTNKLKFRNKL